MSYAFGCVCEYKDGKFTVLCGAHQQAIYEVSQKAIEDCNAALLQLGEMTKHAKEGWDLAATRARQWKDAEQKGRDICCGFGNLLLAVTAMIRHQKDRHELGSCCTDVTPTAAYKLEQALMDLNKLDVVEKPKYEIPCRELNFRTESCTLTAGHCGEHEFPEKRKDDMATCGMEYTVGINSYSTCTRMQGHSGACGKHTITPEPYRRGDDVSDDAMMG